MIIVLQTNVKIGCINKKPLAANETTNVGISYINDNTDAIGLHVENIIDEQILKIMSIIIQLRMQKMMPLNTFFCILCKQN